MVELYSHDNAFGTVAKYQYERNLATSFTDLSTAYSKSSPVVQDYILTTLQKLESYLPIDFCKERDCDSTYDKMLFLVTRYFTKSLDAFYNEKEDLTVLKKIENVLTNNQLGKAGKNKYKLDPPFCKSLAKIYDLTARYITCLSEGICITIGDILKVSNLHSDANILLSHITWARNYDITICLGPIHHEDEKKSCIQKAEKKYSELNSEILYLQRCATTCDTNSDKPITGKAINKKAPLAADKRPVDKTNFLYSLAKVINATAGIHQDFSAYKKQFPDDVDVLILQPGKI